MKRRCQSAVHGGGGLKLNIGSAAECLQPERGGVAADAIANWVEFLELSWDILEDSGTGRIRCGDFRFGPGRRRGRRAEGNVRLLLFIQLPLFRLSGASALLFFSEFL